MGAIEDVYAELDADISEEEFREAVRERVERMDGLVDEEAAANLIAHELSESQVSALADVEPGMDEVKFLAKVMSVGDLRTFERDDGTEGKVVNAEVADETGSVRIALWDEHAQAADDELETGQVLRVKGRPKEGYNGVEVNVDRVEPDEDAEMDVHPGDTARIEDLSLGQSDVNLRGVVLDTESVRTFERDDGSEGRVANLVLGEETGRVRVTLWDERADLAEALEPGTAVEVVDGYVRERDGELELHVGSRGAIEELDAGVEVEYTPEATPIDSVEIGQTVDLAGVVRSADPKRTFERDDGSQGQVRNVRVQDETGDIRVALWGEKADREVAPGDRLALADVEIQDGWQDDLEASAGWRSTVMVLDDAGTPAGERVGGGDDRGGSESAAAARAGGGSESGSEPQATGLDAFAGGSGPADDAGDADASAADEAAGPVEFTGTVVQTGSPVILDNGEETRRVETDADVRLGEEVTVRGVPAGDERIDADEVF